ncbi:MAG: rod shape-determining protein MreD [Bacteroidales bacterium]
MNNKLILSNIFRFLIVILLQVTIFNYTNLFGYINPFVYLYFILLIPFETPMWIALLLAFLTGFTQDLFTSTGGLHAASTTAIAYLRPVLLRTIVSKREYESGLQPGVSDLGWKWFLTYAGVSVFIHSLLVFYLDVFRFSHFFTTFKHAFFQAIATLFFIAMFEFVVNIKKKK